MTYTRKQVVTCISIIYLIIATALAGYAASRATARSVPISETLTSFAAALPIISGLLLEGSYSLTRRQERRQRLDRGEIQRPPLVIVANTIIFIYSCVVITLAGTHVAPSSGLDCGLRERWQTLYKGKSDAIRRIQDAFSCCGLANPRDMAWPFPDRKIDAHACEKAFGRTSGCLGAWRSEEQHVAGILMAVVGMVFLWQFAIIVIPTQKESWIHSVAPDHISRMIADERNGDTESRRAIDYTQGYNRFSDRFEEEDNNGNSGRVIEGGTRRINMLPASPEENQQPTVENEWARG